MRNRFNIQDINLLISQLLEEKKFELGLKESEIAHKELVLNKWEDSLRTRQVRLEKHIQAMAVYEVNMKEKYAKQKANKESFKKKQREEGKIWHKSKAETRNSA